MINYKKPSNLMTLLKSKHDFLDAYSRELYKAKRYKYPITSLNIIIPHKISSNGMKKFILTSFRESDIVYYNLRNMYIQVLLPYTPTEHLDIIIHRISNLYDSILNIDTSDTLKCEKIILMQDNESDINRLISTFDKAEYLAHDNYTKKTAFETIADKLLAIVKKEDTELNFMNSYSGLKLNYKASLVSFTNNVYIFETNPMQLAAIKNTSEVLLEIKKYGFIVNALVEKIDFLLNRVSLSNLAVLDYNNIDPVSLTVELKEHLPAQLIALGSNANIKLSAVSFNEVHGYGDISELVIDNNTLRLSIYRENKDYSLLVKFMHSHFNGETQSFILRIMDDSEKSLELLQEIVTKRSRECIQELKKSIA